MVTLTSNKHATKFREMAEKLQDQIDAKLAPRQTNTWRKIQQAEHAEKEGRQLQVLQDKLRALADAWDTLDVPDILTGVSTKQQVDDLVTFSSYPPPEYNPDIVARLKKARIDADNYADARTALLAMGDPTAGQETEADELRKLEREVARQSIPGFFPTPDEVGDQMIGYLSVLVGDGISTGDEYILEPSAGRGDLADRVLARWPKAVVKVCEINPDLRRVLELKGYDVVCWNFEDFDPGDSKPLAILMNPPFEKFQDIDHVMLAWACVKPGGRVVAIMGESVFFSKQGKAEAFRKWLDEKGAKTIKLPEGSFNTGDKPTGVNARIVVIDSPSVWRSPDDEPEDTTDIMVGIDPPEDDTHEPTESDIDALIAFVSGENKTAPTVDDTAQQVQAETEMNVFDDILAILKAEGPQNTAVLRRKIMALHNGKTYDVMFFSAAIKQMVERRQIIEDGQMTVKLPDEETQPVIHTPRTPAEIAEQINTERIQKAWNGNRTREEDIAFALAYPVDQVKHFWKDWTISDFLEARRQEIDGKNRKGVLAQIERQLKKLRADEDVQMKAILNSTIKPEQTAPDPEELAKHQEYLEVLEGQEVISLTYEGVVGISDGKIWKDGAVIVETPTFEQLKTLFGELFENEFGTSDVRAVLADEFGPYTPPISPEEEQRVADDAVMCDRCNKHRALYYYEPQHDDDFEGAVCAICQAALEHQGSTEQLPLLPEESPNPPETMLLPIAHFMDQIRDIPEPPKSFVESIRKVQLNSILVRKVGNSFRLVDGRRRCKAIAVIARESGDFWGKLVRADVFDADAWTHDAVMALKGNAERSPNVLNELKHIEALASEGYTEKQIAEATGMPIQTIRKRLKLTTLTTDLRVALDEGRIKPSVAEKAVRLPALKQDELAQQAGRITAADVIESKQVQIREAVSFWGNVLPDDEPEPVESRLSDVQLQALIETSTGALKIALLELRVFRSRYGTQESTHASLEN
jgi:hypothetical protein